MTDDKMQIRYEGEEQADNAHHHGGLRPAAGVHSFQVLRANREHPEEADGDGWTYNHAPMLAWWRGRFYLEYLSTPAAEHVPPGRTMLTTSTDGQNWTRPEVVFPIYKIPTGVYRGEGAEKLGPSSTAIMHQRMGFYTAADNRLLVLGFYGICPEPHLLPFDHRGIGRVVREVYEDSNLGPIYFIHINRHAGWNESNTTYPYYTVSPDAGFIAACEALLADPLVTQQWLEEHGAVDTRIHLKGNYKAFCWYTLPDGRTVGLWKWANGGISADRGRSWDWVGRLPSIETAGAKIWGQRTSDGRYALLYNPTTDNKHRWPLAVITGENGIVFRDMLLISGEVPPRRYPGGPFKDYGLNYVRGIAEGNGTPPDGDLWVAYSVNKEDIWVSRIPVPIRNAVTESVDDAFNGSEASRVLHEWNLYSPRWAPVDLGRAPDGSQALRLRDKDPYDYARAERVFPESRKVTVGCRLLTGQSDRAQLFLEVWNPAGRIPVRLLLDSDGWIKVCHGRRQDRVIRYEPDQWYDIGLRVDVPWHCFEVTINGKDTGSSQNYQGERSEIGSWYFLNSVHSVNRLVFRTGPVRRLPDTDVGIEDQAADLPGAGSPLPEAVYYIQQVKVEDYGI
jgi:hypothetical protein